MATLPAQPPLTIREAAAELKLSPETVRKWIKAGLLPAFRVGRQGQYRINPADLRARVVRP